MVIKIFEIILSYYYYLRNLSPIIISYLYLLHKKYNINKIYFILFVSPVILISVYSFMCLIFNNHNNWGFWNFYAPIEWGITLFISTYLLNNNLSDIKDSITISYLIIDSGGLIYEIPLFIRKDASLIYHPQIIAIIYLIIILIDKKIKIDKFIIITIFIYIIYFIIASYMVIPYNYIVRIPTILLLLSIVKNIKIKNQ